MHETGHSKSVQWDNPEGWVGEGGGKGVFCFPHEMPKFDLKYAS